MMFLYKNIEYFQPYHSPSRLGLLFFSSRFGIFNLIKKQYQKKNRFSRDRQNWLKKLYCACCHCPPTACAFLLLSTIVVTLRDRSVAHIPGQGQASFLWVLNSIYFFVMRQNEMHPLK